MKKLMFVLMALSGYWMASAQEIRESVNRLLVQDSVDATTIAGYDAPVRASTFEVATNPQIVANLNDLRLKTNNEFKNKLSTYPREVQQQLWNLARYEGLINELVSAGQLANETRRNLLAKYPDDIRSDAEDCVKNHFDALKDVNLTYNKFNEGFNAMIALLPGVTQKAFKDLLNYPDLLSLLSNNMNLTVRLGDFYHKDAAVLVAAFDTLHNQLEAQKAQDLEDWKAAMQNDPDAAAEYQASAKEFGTAYGYTGDYYNSTNPVVIEHYVFVPYAYWCGYPWWYEYQCWYPYPYWYYWGFTYWGGQLVWLSPPSWYFMHWHFGHPHHHHHYPHVTNCYINYYYGHHRSAPGNNAQVGNFIEHNREIVRADFGTNANNRVEEIKQLGKLEMDREEYNKKTATPVSENDYLKKHAGEFPLLKSFEEPGVLPAKQNNPTTKPTEPTKNNDNQRYDYYDREKQPNTQPVQPKQQPQQQQNVPSTQPKNDYKPYTEPKQQNTQPTQPKQQYNPPTQPKQQYNPPTQPKQNYQPAPQPKPNINPQPRQNPSPSMKPKTGGR